jgi:hypothetical protein
MKPSPLEFALRLPLLLPSPRKWLAGRVLLARELGYLRWSVWEARSEFPEFAFETWDAWCRDAARMSAKEQAQFNQCRLLIMDRLAACGNEKALRMMEERPSNLFALQRESLIELMVQDAMTTTETAATLKRAAKAIRPAEPADSNPRRSWTPDPPPKSPSPVDVFFQVLEVKRTALRMGMAPEVAEQVAMRILVKDWAAGGCKDATDILKWMRDQSRGGSGLKS